MATFFFCGIGGIGMSAIALYLKRAGHIVLGSDRSFDLGRNDDTRHRLLNEGIQLFPQNGTSLSSHIDTFVVSSAVEDSIPDVKRAKELNLKIKTRADVLSEIFNTHYGVAVAGTSGKTTTTAMIGHILYSVQHPVMMINGGISQNKYNGNACSNLLYTGEDLCLIEADESDGSIERYTADIGVLTNVSLDHKSLEEIKKLFGDFLNRCKHGTVMNLDDPESCALGIDRPNNITFSIKGNKEATLCVSDIKESLDGCSFVLNGAETKLPILGTYNIENALAAIGACIHLGIPVASSIQALQSFKGTQRRMNLIGVVDNVYVFDDYAHNPAKISAAIKAILPLAKRVFVIYQPHGFAPLRLTKDDLISTLNNVLCSKTEWLMLPIFYVGGTVSKDISNNNIVEPLQAAGKRAFAFDSRKDVLSYCERRVCPDDAIIVMGARDETLTDFAKEIVKTLSRKDNA